MNQDHQVDDVLKDLDTALSIEPSPSVAAKVRARIADESTQSSWSRIFAGHVFGGRPFRFAGAAALLLVAIASYVMWPRPKDVPPSSTRTIAQTPPPLPVTPTVPVVPAKMPPKVAAVRRPAPQVAPAEREPEVLISPAIRLALAQFDALTRGSVATVEPEPGIPETIEPGVIVIDVVRIDPPAQTAGGGIRR